jgi:hypothetical protein
LPGAASRGRQGLVRKFALCREIRMDIERINAVGSLLADLSQRTEQLRGYL